MNYQTIIEKSVSLMNDGITLVDNLRQSNTSDPELNLYIRSVIYYNYHKYDKCVENLIFCYDHYNKIDYTLFSYASHELLSIQDNIDDDLLYNICRTYSGIKNLYEKNDINLLNSAMSTYLNKLIKSKQSIPTFIADFLNDILSLDNVKKIYLDQKCNDILSLHINFDKLHNKNIINCFYNESSSGIGDFLRGCCYLFDLLNSKNIQCNINFSKHDISKYLKSSHYINFKKSDIFDTEKRHKEISKGSQYITNIKNNIINALENTAKQNITLFTNYSDFIDNPEKAHSVTITKDCQCFMQNNLIFSKTIETEFASVRESINNRDYAIMHFRLGDRQIFKNVKLDNNNVNTKEYNLSFAKLKKEIINKYNDIKKDIIVMSDSNDFKTYIENKLAKKYKKYIHVIHTKSQHCSNNPGNIIKLDINKQQKIDNMFYVALDMKLISKSSAIYSYSVYAWGSGFVFWLAKIFNIPIHSQQIGDNS